MADLTNEQGEVEKARAAFDEAQAFADEAKAVLEQAQQDLDAAIVAAEGPKHPHQDQIDRMAYIRSQAEQRAARHGIAVQLREGSPDPDVLDPRSQLDKAMQRNTKRGTARPKAASK